MENLKTRIGALLVTGGIMAGIVAGYGYVLSENMKKARAARTARNPKYKVTNLKDIIVVENPYADYILNGEQLTTLEDIIVVENPYADYILNGEQLTTAESSSQNLDNIPSYEGYLKKSGYKAIYKEDGSIYGYINFFTNHIVVFDELTNEDSYAKVRK